MMRHVIQFFVFFLGINLAVLPPTQADDHSSDLSISPVVQQKQVWCWAAVSEMVLEHFNYGSVNPVDNFQCGVVAMLGSGCEIDCSLCNTGIGSLHNLTLVLLNYQYFAYILKVDGDQFKPQVTGRLTPDQVVSKIDEGAPIVAGISPSGMGQFYPPSFGEHVALIVGYEDGGRTLIVNDPFPYTYVGHDPYLNLGAETLELGQYLVDYDTFRFRLGYKDSIYFNF